MYKYQYIVWFNDSVLWTRPKYSGGDKARHSGANVDHISTCEVHHSRLVEKAIRVPTNMNSEVIYTAFIMKKRKA